MAGRGPGGAAPKSAEVARLRSARAVAVRKHGLDSPEAHEAKRALEGHKYADRVEQIIAGWPELAGERLERVAALLRAGR